MPERATCKVTVTSMKVLLCPLALGNCPIPMLLQSLFTFRHQPVFYIQKLHSAEVAAWEDCGSITLVWNKKSTTTACGDSGQHTPDHVADEAKSFVWKRLYLFSPPREKLPFSGCFLRRLASHSHGELFFFWRTLKVLSTNLFSWTPTCRSPFLQGPHRFKK